MKINLNHGNGGNEKHGISPCLCGTVVQKITYKIETTLRESYYWTLPIPFVCS